ncbi:MAG: hypothetical protein ABSC90_12330 [Acidimicrobiales bacterium]
MIIMDTVYLLAASVRAWVEERWPDDPGLADRAVSAALDSFFAGASVAEAAEQARHLIAEWIEHPANDRSPGPLRHERGLAS